MKRNQKPQKMVKNNVESKEKPEYFSFNTYILFQSTTNKSTHPQVDYSRIFFLHAQHSLIRNSHWGIRQMALRHSNKT